MGLKAGLCQRSNMLMGLHKGDKQEGRINDNKP